MKSPETYYRDHWVTIEPERLDAYEQMFRWRPEMDALIAPAEIAPGQSVLDFGCGPGWLALELARRVGPSGHVHALDVNQAFLERAAAHVAAEDLQGRVSFHHVAGERIPLDDRTLDRVVTKNVLEYVSDLEATLVEMRRVLKPGGRLHVVDSDWGMLAVEPLGAEAIGELFAAASVAYRTPLIGRMLYGAMRASGYADVKVQILASADTRGHFSPIVFNMASYARASGRMPEAKIDRILEALKRSLEHGTYLLVLPQFLVTATA
jgi:ubiquinone/menaquinone biosynthesis C-methylase UbiE